MIYETYDLLLSQTISVFINDIAMQKMVIYYLPMVIINELAKKLEAIW